MSFSTDPVIHIQNADIYQENNLILEQVSFQVGKGEFLYLVGRTGSGKSSLLKTLYADIPLVSGQIDIAGFNIQHIKRKQVPYLRRKLGIIFQDFQLFDDRTVAENLIFVMKATGWKSKAKITQRLTEVLMRVGLANSGQKMPHQLSGGEQQRVVIARALLNEPVLLVADEPTGNLDPEVADGIMKLFMEINASGTTIVMATHNHNFIQKYPKRILKCENGKVADSNVKEFELNNVW